MRHLVHRLGAGNVAQRLGDKSGIAIGFLPASLEIGGHFLRGAEMFGDVVGGGFGDA